LSLDPAPLFFSRHTQTPLMYTLSLHDALPISSTSERPRRNTAWSSQTSTLICWPAAGWFTRRLRSPAPPRLAARLVPRRPCHCRSEEHTSELQSRENLVCRLLLEKKKKKHYEH